jgi:hypothetical protein
LTTDGQGVQRTPLKFYEYCGRAIYLYAPRLSILSRSAAAASRRSPGSLRLVLCTYPTWYKSTSRSRFHRLLGPGTLRTFWYSLHPSLPYPSTLDPRGRALDDLSTYPPGHISTHPSHPAWTRSSLQQLGLAWTRAPPIAHKPGPRPGSGLGSLLDH